MGTQMTWEDELKTLLSGNWRPCFRGGFAVMGQVSCGMVWLYPPQGVYSLWTGRLLFSGTDRPVVVHGETAAKTIGLVRRCHAQFMAALKDMEVSGTRTK